MGAALSGMIEEAPSRSGGTLADFRGIGRIILTDRPSEATGWCMHGTQRGCVPGAVAGSASLGLVGRPRSVVHRRGIDTSERTRDDEPGPSGPSGTRSENAMGLITYLTTIRFDSGAVKDIAGD